MKMINACFAGWFLMAATSALGQKQVSKVPISTQLTLEASEQTQHGPINSVLMMNCKTTRMKGTGFIVSGGTVVTAAHVLCGCGVENIEASTTSGEHVTFSKFVHDDDRDIAALRPSQVLRGGLELALDSTVKIAERVNTWGFPLIYNGPAPLISVGYVSGYYQANPAAGACNTPPEHTSQVTHLVVNAAFNPGNSGGPLFVFGQNKVIGLVIWKKIAFSDTVRVAVDGFTHARTTLGGNFSQTMEDGTTRSVTDQEMIGLVLGEFYNRVQVDIGEAIAVSEVRAFLREHANELKSEH